MCAVVLPVSPLPTFPSSITATALPARASRYAVVMPAMPPPTIAISTKMSRLNFWNWSDPALANQDDSRLPAVFSSQPSAGDSWTCIHQILPFALIRLHKLVIEHLEAADVLLEL